ncbi:MAG: MMPL family transporter [Oscillospiraceae bacterium]|nr:MMPL family transporter [Oscillospiraceae bacterium]
MERFASNIIRRRKAIIALFAAIAAICALLYFTVQVNYDMTDYLPPDAQSTIALKMLDAEFADAIPNAIVTIDGISLMEAREMKQELQSCAHIISVIWLDDIVDLTRPIEMMDKTIVEEYYIGETARYSAVIEKGFEREAIRQIRTLVGSEGTVTGEAADIEFMQSAATSEVLQAMLILVPVIVLILLLSTSSWIEPLLFLAAIGMSVLINMGTNAFLGSVSFVTNSVTPILQLAVSLDYAIFLLHSFSEHRESGLDVDDAMRKAVKDSFSTVAASASTTLFGFLALVFMDFRIGADLGLNLAKGIVFSFISVIVFLPALTICAYKAIDKTRHRGIVPAFANIHNMLRRAAIPVVAIVAVIIIPCFLGQSRTDFLYGYLSAAQTRSFDAAAPEEDPTTMVLLVPRGDAAREELLCSDILELPYVLSVASYVNTVGSGIPPEFLGSAVSGQFYSENLARIIVSVDAPTEGGIAFEAVEQITAAAERHYPFEAYSAGQSVNIYDIKNIVQKDNRITNIIAIAAIFMVLVITFKSALRPLLLLFTIEAAIWINLSIPFFTGTSISYIGYLVLNTVQLGATVDYAILLTVAYTRNKRSMPLSDAIHKALGDSFRSILVSAAILATAGFTLASTSSIPIVNDIGMLLGRGTLLSMLMVLVFLPAVLTFFDRFNRTNIKQLSN